MPIAAGTRLGPYEIVAPLGAGGMGEVYRARDARLGRDVAIKVLPSSLATHPERLKRFEKEARAASALNHPNLVTIHDIGSSNGVEFIAMELVDGRTLREVLAEGAMMSRQLLGIAAQAADGLAKAHGAGIVHRDLKPENIMVTRDGFVKILDFGLAKLTQPEQASEATAAPTVSGATEPGIVMGTAGYMSPEQALGKPVDYRSDQFSLGSILYEMATGRRAFSRGSTPETLSAIIREEPEPVGSLAPSMPAPLRWVVERCLAKNPDDRYAATRDLSRDLATLRDRIGEASGGAVRDAGAPARAAKRGLPWWLAAVLVAVAVALGFGLRRPSAVLPAPLVRFSVVMPNGVEFESGEIEGHAMLSPDGKKLVFVGYSRGGRRLYLRHFDSLESRELEGTEGGISPFWSPDSRSIGFFSDGKLLRLEVSGGPPRLICDAPFLETLPTWGSSGQILFSQIGPNDPGIYIVAASGGQPRRLLYSGRSENFGLWPFFLPDGKHFLYLNRNFQQNEDRRWYLRAGSIDSEKFVSIAYDVWSRIEYVRPGFLLFARQGALMAQAFDTATFRLSGETVTLADHVYYFNGPAMAGFSASSEGVLAYEKLRTANRVVWFDRTGRELETIFFSGSAGSVRLSPDGKTLATHVWDEKTGTSDLWLYDLGRRLPLRLTLDVGDDQTPVWSADGSKIFFRADRIGPPDLYEIPANSPGRDRRILERPGVQHPEDASPDGGFLLFTEYSRRTNGDLMLWPLSGGEVRPLEQGPFDERDGRFSPDGRWIAYVSGETGAREVYLRPIEGRGERIRVSTRGGQLPHWRRDGKELFYLSGDADIVSVPMRWTPSPEPGTPTVLFRLDGVVKDFDVDASGQRFVVDLATPEPAPIGVLLNWPDLMPAAPR